MTVRTWARDLALGIRFGASGGREGWTRTLLTALGVGLGVAMLLLASSAPGMVQQREARGDARVPVELKNTGAPEAARTDRTALWDQVETSYQGRTIQGVLLEADGSDPVRPPGVSVFPKPGEMVVSPAFGELLRSPEGKLLAERYDARIVGTIGDEGLLGSRDFYFYLGNDRLSAGFGATRISAYDDKVMVGEPLNPVLVVLIILICVVLLVPVAVFVAAAVRFGGERRDRRLAALRLVGVDARSVRRIAAGEALFGALLGLAAGIGLFSAVRPLAAEIGLYGLSAFPADVMPSPLLGALTLVAVPVSAVAVTLFALRTVAIEPLGVVRQTTPASRRLWWRLLLTAAGLAVLLTGRIDRNEANPAVFPIAAGAVLVLVGLTTLLPWLVDTAVGRLRGGPVPWQLAVRRLQLSSGAAARAVSGIMVAVAGGIALQMLFSAVEGDFVKNKEGQPGLTVLSAETGFTDAESARRMVAGFERTDGVRKVTDTVQTRLHLPPPTPEEAEAGAVQVESLTLTVGDCATLRELARISSCRDGDAFVAVGKDKERAAEITRSAALGKPYATVEPDSGDSAAKDGGRPGTWSLPKGSATVVAHADAMGDEHAGILATPGAVDLRSFPAAGVRTLVFINEKVPEAAEHIRNAVAGIDPRASVVQFLTVEEDDKFAKVRSGLLIGSLVTMLLIAGSMLVSQIEQLRERRKLLSVLVAFGTRRSTIAWSVLWQTALPVLLGTVLAIAGGIGLGLVMLELVGAEVADRWGFLPVAGAGVGVIVVVTGLAMPPLYRMMRPDGLRTE
ncbi:FtsX-like permease family protein [Streptomyces sp. NPDC003691]